MILCTSHRVLIAISSYFDPSQAFIPFTLFPCPDLGAGANGRGSSSKRTSQLFHLAISGRWGYPCRIRSRVECNSRGLAEVSKVAGPVVLAADASSTSLAAAREAQANISSWTYLINYTSQGMHNLNARVFRRPYTHKYTIFLVCAKPSEPGIIRMKLDGHSASKNKVSLFCIQHTKTACCFCPSAL